MFGSETAGLQPQFVFAGFDIVEGEFSAKVSLRTPAKFGAVQLHGHIREDSTGLIANDP